MTAFAPCRQDCVHVSSPIKLCITVIGEDDIMTCIDIKVKVQGQGSFCGDLPNQSTCICLYCNGEKTTLHCHSFCLYCPLVDLCCIKVSYHQYKRFSGEGNSGFQIKKKKKKAENSFCIEISRIHSRKNTSSNTMI